jgi:hypothetical protein
MANELKYRVVRDDGLSEEVARSAYERALFVYPKDHLLLCERTRVILKSKER